MRLVPQRYVPMKTKNSFEIDQVAVLISEQAVDFSAEGMVELIKNMHRAILYH